MLMLKLSKMDFSRHVVPFLCSKGISLYEAVSRHRKILFLQSF